MPAEHGHTEPSFPERQVTREMLAEDEERDDADEERPSSLDQARPGGTQREMENLDDELPGDDA
jgi:hypothetical protein